MTDQVKRSLEEKLATLMGRVTKIESDLRDPGSKNWTERGTEAENDEVLERLGDAERSEIQQIQAALDRIATGSYFTCSRCGEPIAAGRLEALPYTTVCIAWARWKYVSATLVGSSSPSCS